MTCWNNSDTHTPCYKGERRKHWQQQQQECLPLYIITQPMWISWWERNATDSMAGGFCVSVPNNMDVLPLWHVRYLSLHINGWLLLGSSVWGAACEVWALSPGLWVARWGGGMGSPHGLLNLGSELWTQQTQGFTLLPHFAKTQRHLHFGSSANFLNGNFFPSFSNTGVRVTNFVIVNCLET
jgi:hypothetical protein